MDHLHKFTQDEVALARRIWAAAGVNLLSKEDREQGRALGLIEGWFASNLCNDVCHGHEWADDVYR